jgi:hypothetical protein
MTVAIGLAILTQSAFLLGLAGWLRAPIVAAVAIGLLGAAAIAAAIAWRRTAAASLDADGAAAAATEPTRNNVSAAAAAPEGSAAGAGSLAGVRRADRRGDERVGGDGDSDSDSDSDRHRRVTTWTVVAALACPPFLLALYPPLGFDQTLYHLPYARAFAASGGLPFLPTLRFPAFAQLAEVLNAAVLLFADDVSTQMTGWLALVTCAGLAFVWARELSSAAFERSHQLAQRMHDAPEAPDVTDVRDVTAESRDREDRGAAAGGWMAAAILAGSPIAVYLGATGYVEPMLGLFGLASLYAADRARRQKDVAWILAAGALAGSAASVKYLGLFFVPASALLLMLPGPAIASGSDGDGNRDSKSESDSVDVSDDTDAGRRQRQREHQRQRQREGERRVPPRSTWLAVMRALAWYSLAAAAALAPTYGRLVALTGNPLFPFYPALFGSSPWDAQEYLGRRGVARLLAVSTFLWDVTFRRHAVGGLPFWSPAFAFGAPIALLGAWRQAALRPLLLVAAGYLLLAPVNAHYFFGIAPLWCVIAGAAASRLAGPSRIGQRLLLAAAIVIALGGDAYTVYRVHKLGPPPTTMEGREQLLAAQLPLYPAIAFLNRTAGPVVVYGVHAENMVDYVTGTLLGDNNGPASFTHIATRARTLGSLGAALDEIHASYLLVPTLPLSAPWTEQATAAPRLARIYSDDAATLYRVLPASPSQP